MYECYVGRFLFVFSSFIELVNFIILDFLLLILGNFSFDFENLVICLFVKDLVERI